MVLELGANPVPSDVTVTLSVEKAWGNAAYFNGDNLPNPKPTKPQDCVRIFVPSQSQGGDLVPKEGDAAIIGPGTGASFTFLDCGPSYLILATFGKAGIGRFSLVLRGEGLGRRPSAVHRGRAYCRQYNERGVAGKVSGRRHAPPVATGTAVYIPHMGRLDSELALCSK